MDVARLAAKVLKHTHQAKERMMSDPRQRKRDRQQQEAIKRAEYAIIEKAILRGHGAASAAFVTGPIHELRLAIMENKP